MSEPQDPAANSHKMKSNRPRPERVTEPTDSTQTADKKVERVVSEGGVTEAKKGLGRKFREVFGGVDAKGAASYVILEVMIPAARGMAVDVGTRFVEKIFYPDQAPPGRRIYGPTGGYAPPTSSRVTYSASPGYRPPVNRPPMGRRVIESTARPTTDYVIASRAEANLVVERMGDLIEAYGVVSVADLHDLIGIDSVHTDNKWGWDRMRGVDVRPSRDGFLISVPPPEPLNN